MRKTKQRARPAEHAESWRMVEEGRDDLILCYDHSRHFLVRDRAKRAGRAGTDACEHCAEFDGTNQHNGAIDPTWNGKPHDDLSIGTLLLIASAAMLQAKSLRQRAEEHEQRGHTFLVEAQRRRNAAEFKPDGAQAKPSVRPCASPRTRGKRGGAAPPWRRPSPEKP